MGNRRSKWNVSQSFESNKHNQTKRGEKIRSYLHQCNVIHRDLKPDNLLVDHIGVCKVSDFGCSSISNKIRKQMTVIGTPCLFPFTFNHQPLISHSISHLILVIILIESLYATGDV
jgi:serine/threonine protein kinase